MKRIVFRTVILLGLVCAGCFAYGLWIEPKFLKVRELEFVSEKYDGSPLRIGLITDIHIGGIHVPPERMARIVDTINALEPDVILMPGDFVNGHTPREKRADGFDTILEAGISALAALDAPAFATIGNHDAWYDSSHVETLLKAANVTVLKNEAQLFNGLCLVGLEDEYTGAPNKAAFQTCPPERPALVLVHSPQSWPTFRSDTVLALAGHTHGGQVNLPLIGRRVNSTTLGAEHSYGFSKLGGVDVFVSAGIGTSILPVRFRSPPEIVVITLRAPQ